MNLRKYNSINNKDIQILIQNSERATHDLFILWFKNLTLHKTNGVFCAINTYYSYYSEVPIIEVPHCIKLPVRFLKIDLYKKL